MAINLNIKHNETTILDMSSGSKTLYTENKYVGDNLIFTLTGVDQWDSSVTGIVKKPTNLNPTFTYTGTPITNKYRCPTHVTMIGEDRGTAGGTYVATYTPNSGYTWEDGTTTSVNVTLTIQYRWTTWNVVPYYGYNKTIFTVPAGERVQVLSSKSYVVTDCEYVEDPIPGFFDSSTGLFTYKWDDADSEFAYVNGGIHPFATTNDISETSILVNEMACTAPITTSSAPSAKLYADGTVEPVYPQHLASTGYKYTSYQAGYNKGSTQYADVYSTNINAYPTVEGGAEQGGYWYVKAW